MSKPPEWQITLEVGVIVMCVMFVGVLLVLAVDALVRGLI